MDRGPIVVGTDFSNAAQAALGLASQIAVRTQSPLHVVHAWNTGLWSANAFSGEIPLEPLLALARTSASEALERLAESCRAQGCETTAVLEDGAASRLLPTIAAREHANLIVVGRKGSAQLSHVLLGSVSERVVRGSGCPVLVVPESASPPSMPSRFLVGLDFSSASLEALHAAAELSIRFGCERPNLLAHAYQDERAEWLASWSETGKMAMRGRDSEAVERWARDQLGEQARFEITLVEGIAEDVLLQTAREQGCDWVCLGLQGRTALASFLVGSTTRRILEMADRPILVVPPQSAPERESVG